MIKNKILFFLSNHFPGLGKYKRFLYAVWDTFRSKKMSYSQHQEDIELYKLIMDKKLTAYPFFDIGANHPTTISNSYLLYRNGMTGYCIDPNSELIQLHAKFRKKDKQLCIGCGSTDEIREFYISKTPVISSFEKLEKNNFFKSEFLPILKMDTVIKNLNIEKISLLSIDVEGLSIEVLKGAKETLLLSDIICIEFDSEDEIEVISTILSNSFVLHKKIGCNLIYIKKEQ